VNTKLLLKQCNGSRLLLGSTCRHRIDLSARQLKLDCPRGQRRVARSHTTGELVDLALQCFVRGTIALNVLR
jgi:ferredoxin